MEIKKVIIHELIKESGLNETKLVLSDDLIQNDENLTGLITALNKSYNSDRILYAVFDDSEGKYFPEKFKEYMHSKRENPDFITFTRSTIGNLENFIKPINLATGGYFVFAEFESNNSNFIGVFLIRDIEGKTISRTKNNFSIRSVEYVDTSHLAMACRINEDKLNASLPNYLSLTQVRQQEISEYFKNWISIKQLETSKEFTSQLYNIISQIERPINPDTSSEFEIEVFRNSVYNYIISSPNKTINICELSQYFYDDPLRITKYANENDITIDTEFRYNGRELKKFIKVEVNRDGINLRFSRGVLNEKIRLSDQNEDLVIIESKAFASALRKELENN
jgi:nucleoid-associated protein